MLPQSAQQSDVEAIRAASGKDCSHFGDREIRVLGLGARAGSVKATPKVSTTIRLSADVIQAFRAAGDGWQTRIDAALKDWLRTHSPV